MARALERCEIFIHDIYKNHDTKGRIRLNEIKYIHKPKYEFMFSTNSSNKISANFPKGSLKWGS